MRFKKKKSVGIRIPKVVNWKTGSRDPKEGPLKLGLWRVLVTGNDKAQDMAIGWVAKGE